MKEQQAKPLKRRFTKPVIAVTVLIQIFLSGIICVALVFYSPFFDTVKKFIVCSAMETGSHQWIATMFLSDAQIKKIMGGSASSAVQQTLHTVTNHNVGNTDIEESKVDGSSFNGYVLEIKDPMRVKVAMTKTVGRTGQFTSVMAEQNNAVAAVNGGGFSGGSGLADGAKYPSYFVIQNGEVKWKDKNWDEDQEVNVIALDRSGVLIVGERSINDLKKLNVSEAVAFTNNDDLKPVIVNGQGTYKPGEAMSRSQRTIIAQRKDSSILLIALDGRDFGKGGFGATYYEEQQLLLEKLSSADNPIVTATNLDGGHSTTLYYNGEVINKPAGEFKEKAVATAFYVRQ